MAKHPKHVFTLTALTLAASPAYAEEARNTHSSVDTLASVSRAEKGLASPTAPEPIQVQAKDIDVEGPDSVALRSPGLAYELTFHPQEALELLSEVSPINLANITLDENGRVVVQDAEFVAKLRDKVGGQNLINLEANNGVCGFGC